MYKLIVKVVVCVLAVSYCYSTVLHCNARYHKTIVTGYNNNIFLRQPSLNWLTFNNLLTNIHYLHDMDNAMSFSIGKLNSLYLNKTTLDYFRTDPDCTMEHQKNVVL